MAILSMLFGSKNVKNLNSSEFQKHLTENDNSILIDVRTQEEHEEIRIPNSMLIDISQADFLDKINKLDKQKSYYLYCRSGSRSLNAATKMDKLGFEKVYNLAGGIIAWDGATER